ncbi:hypothetical protein BHE74_00026747, partial [Ensete ventricosum]
WRTATNAASTGRRPSPPQELILLHQCDVRREEAGGAIVRRSCRGGDDIPRATHPPRLLPLLLAEPSMSSPLGFGMSSLVTTKEF